MRQITKKKYQARSPTDYLLICSFDPIDLNCFLLPDEAIIAVLLRLKLIFSKLIDSSANCEFKTYDLAVVKVSLLICLMDS